MSFVHLSSKFRSRCAPAGARAMGHAAIVLTVWVMAAAQPVAAQPGGTDCSDLVVNRSYSLEFHEGFLNVPVMMNVATASIGIVPNAGAGTITFLPQGQAAVRTTLAVGQIALVTDMVYDNTSHYSLTWDGKTPASCVGTLTANTPGDSANFELRAFPGGQQIQLVHTDPGLIVSMTGYPVETSGCTNNILDGLYSYEAKGWAMSPQVAPLKFPGNQMLVGYYPFAMSGVMRFNSHDLRPPVVGAGTVTWTDMASANGAITKRSGTGWFKITKDCTGMISLTEPTLGQSFTLEAFVGKDGGAVYMVNVDGIPVQGGAIPAVILGFSAKRVNAQ